MKLSSLKRTPGSRKKPKLLGRGDATGQGGTSGRGHKGDKARSGARIRLHFEGGQNTFFRRLPKRGFKNADKKILNVINVGLLSKSFSANDVIDADILRSKDLIADNSNGIKVLGDGAIDKPLIVKAEAFSFSARAKIEASGGKCEIVGGSEKIEKAQSKAN